MQFNTTFILASKSQDACVLYLVSMVCPALKKYISDEKAIILI